jgi:phytoene synthase
MRYSEYAKDVTLCRTIHKKYGKSFYFGTVLLPKVHRDATSILYAFFRYPDEYVDTYHKDANQKEVALIKLNEFNTLWAEVYRGDTIQSDDATLISILRATKYVFDTFRIPFECSQDFMKSMIQDVTKDRYESYEGLRKYMYGSASVVGIMMCYILCSQDKRFTDDTRFRLNVLEKAGLLGEAFQMTNFLRDIGEDVQERGRIYIPKNDLQRWGVSEKDIYDKKVTDNFIQLMKHEIDRTRHLYAQAEEGVYLLPQRAGRGIYVARVLYAKILDKIEQAKYDTLSKRASLSFGEKLLQATKAVFSFTQYGK